VNSLATVDAVLFRQLSLSVTAPEGSGEVRPLAATRADVAQRRINGLSPRVVNA